MRILLYKGAKNSRSIKKDYRISFERLLFVLFIAAFSLLVIVQAAMTNPSVRTFLVAESEFEGTQLGAEEFLYKEGSITLRLIGEESNPSIKVLVNGDEVAVFNDSVVSIPVMDKDVVEIDGSASFNAAEVQVIEKSDNVAADCLGKKVRVVSNINKLADIKVK